MATVTRAGPVEMYASALAAQVRKGNIDRQTSEVMLLQFDQAERQLLLIERCCEQLEGLRLEKK